MLDYQSVPLQMDFGSFKNKLKETSKCDWIYQIDADELPSEYMLENIHELVFLNDDIDVMLVPRINTVHGITIDHVNKWGWSVNVFTDDTMKISENKKEMSDGYIEFLNKCGAICDDDGDTISYYTPVINYPDYQWRLYKNIDTIKWVNKVHERLVGFDIYTHLPSETVEYAMSHDKHISRQEKQNSFYNTIQ